MSDLPTKPGPYYWREKDGDKWSIKEVYVNYKTKNLEAAHISSLDGRGLSMQSPEYIGGQWLPIPTADELVELQAKAKAKAYDEGTQQIAVYSEVIWSDNYLNMLEKADLTFGSPKVRVRVCKEVVV
jgi:hypothetical protein